MADKVNRTFRINSGFVKSVAEWYCFDQADLRRATEIWAKRNQSEMPNPGPRQPIPERRITRDIRSILEEAFWASLRTEEDRLHNFALVYQPQGRSGPLNRDPVVFEKPKAFDSITLAKIAPALHSTQLIGVWPRDAATESSKLIIWGLLGN